MIPSTRFSLFALLLSVAALAAPSAQAMVPAPSASNATFAGAPGSDVDARLDRITRALQQREGGAAALTEGSHGQDLAYGFANGARRGFANGPNRSGYRGPAGGGFVNGHGYYGGGAGFVNGGGGYHGGAFVNGNYRGPGFVNW